MNCLWCSSWCLPKMSSSPPLFLVISDEIRVSASGSTRNASGEVLQAHQCSSHSVMPKILFTRLSWTFNGANAPPECLLGEQGSAQKSEDKLPCTHACTHTHFQCLHLHTNKILLLYMSTDVALVTVVELENLLDATMSNAITLIL